MATRSTDDAGGDPSKRLVVLAETRADVVLSYPDGEFRASDIRESLRRHLPRLQEAGVAVVVDRYEDAANKFLHVYRIADRARAAAQRQQETRDSICPCGHSGVQNCGDHYECAFGLCEREFARDELEVDR